MKNNCPVYTSKSECGRIYVGSIGDHIGIGVDWGKFTYRDYSGSLGMILFTSVVKIMVHKMELLWTPGRLASGHHKSTHSVQNQHSPGRRYCFLIMMRRVLVCALVI